MVIMAYGEPEFSREELLQGLAKRASTLLLVIESWAAQHKAQSQLLMKRFLT